MSKVLAIVGNQYHNNVNTNEKKMKMTQQVLRVTPHTVRSARDGRVDSAHGSRVGSTRAGTVCSAHGSRVRFARGPRVKSARGDTVGSARGAK